MKQIKFNQEEKDILPYYKEDDFEIIDYANAGGTAKIYNVLFNEKKLIGKIFNDNSFMHPYREFMLEFNIKSSFSIQPIALIKKDGDYYLIMENFRHLADFSNYFFNSAKNADMNELSKNKKLSTLLIITSLLHALQSLHVQKIPLIHHDIKPGNVLLAEYKLDEDENLVKPSNINYSKKIYTNGHFYFSQLIDFGMTKENQSVTGNFGTMSYRTSSLYLESSDLFSVAIIIKLLIHDCTEPAQLIRKQNFVYKRDSITSTVTAFYYRDKAEICNLDILVNMLLDGFKKRESNIFDVMDILTIPGKFSEIFSKYLDEETKNKYFKILEKANIIQSFNQKFVENAPKIYGENYKAFLFTLFHQKNNEFDPDTFKEYQSSINEIFSNSSRKQYVLINKIAEYHYNTDFFSFKEIFDRFSTLFNIKELNNEGYSINAKLFKILTSLNFKNTRSLNHFSNALNYSLSSSSIEEEYDLQMCFGKDYQAKVGYMLLQSANDQRELFDLIVRKAKRSIELRKDFYKDNEDEDEVKDNKDIEKFGINYNISQFDIITLSFLEFLEAIHVEQTDTIEEKSIYEYQKMTMESEYQQKMKNKLIKEYGENDAIFLLFMHYLYYFEYKDEQHKIYSINNDNFEDSDYGSSDNDDKKNFLEDIEKMKRDELKDLKYLQLKTLEDEEDKFIFSWLIPFRFGNLINDILSKETIIKLKNKIPTILFLRSLGIDALEFNIFLNYLLSSKKLDQFQRIVNNYNTNHAINAIASKLQFLESISILSIDFFNTIIYKILAEKVEDKDFLKFIQIEELFKKNLFYEDINDSDIRTRINFPYVVYPFGKIKYVNGDSQYLSNLDATARSKIAVLLVHTFNYLANLPFKIPIHIGNKNILIDKDNKPIIILSPFKTDLKIIEDFGDVNRDFTNYDNAFWDFKTIIGNLEQNRSENNFLKIINNYQKISPSTDLNSRGRRGEDLAKSYITFQYIFELFLDKSLNFTFAGTNIDVYNAFINNTFKGPFYDDNFKKFAYELFGQSYAVKLDYLFTRLNVNSNLTKKSFVADLLNRINTNKSTLLTIFDDHETLLSIANLLEQNFDEDPYHFVYRLRQLGESKESIHFGNERIDKYNSKLFKYVKSSGFKEESIQYIFHIQNKFISPLINSDQKNLYFNVPVTKYNIDNLQNIADSCKYKFYFSLKSALYYLSNYSNSELLLPNKLSANDIYINEMYEAIVLPFTIDTDKMKEILKKVYDDLELDTYISPKNAFDSYASYIPIKDEYSIKLMKVFGLDYFTELNEILNSTGTIDKTNNDFYLSIGDDSCITDDDDYEHQIFERFDEECNKFVISDENILEMTSKVNKLTPLFTHLLEKASQSKNKEIEENAIKRLNIFQGIKEIPRDQIKIIETLGDGAECIIYKSQYNGQNVAFKMIKSDKYTFDYLQKIKNMLYLLKIIDENEVKKYIADEIGFTNFGIIMELYKTDLKKKIDNEFGKLYSELKEKILEYNDAKKLKLKEKIKEERSKKNIDEVENGLLYLQILMKTAQDINFLHSYNIVHYDFKFENVLLTDDNTPLLGDNINIQIEHSFFKSRVFTEGRTCEYLTTQKHQDTYAYETSCIDFLNQINSIYDDDIYSCPIITKMENNVKNLKESKGKEGDHPTIEHYLKKSFYEQDVHFLPASKENTSDEEKQYKLFSSFALSQSEAPTIYSDVLKMNVKSIKDFNYCYDHIKDFDENNSFYIRFFIIFSPKLYGLKSELKTKKKFILYIKKIDKIILDKFINDSNDKDGQILTFYRFNLNHFDNTELKDEQYLRMQFLLYQYVKNESDFNEELLKTVTEIIDYLIDKNDNHVGFFFNYLFPPGKERKEILKENIDLRLKAVCFYYYYNTKVKKREVDIDDYKELILEIYKIIINQPDKRDDFKKWLIDAPQDDEVIALFFYVYSNDLIRFSGLNSIFDEISKFELDHKSKDEKVNVYLKHMIDAFNFKKENGEKYKLIYENYVLPSLK